MKSKGQIGGVSYFCKIFYIYWPIRGMREWSNTFSLFDIFKKLRKLNLPLHLPLTLHLKSPTQVEWKTSNLKWKLIATGLNVFITWHKIKLFRGRNSKELPESKFIIKLLKSIHFELMLEFYLSKQILQRRISYVAKSQYVPTSLTARINVS